MKQLTVISGKGGTGKTSIAAAFAILADNKVIADCDVDAADLHLILLPDIKKRMDFFGSKLAVMDEDKCIECGLCEENCRFNAIKNLKINPLKCEGCTVCEYVCPVDAIKMEDRISGEAFISDTRAGPMAHAALYTAEETSGKLVTLVRNNARIIARQENKDLIIIDGPPGIGCSVISAITGVDLVLAVTEPTLSGISDLKRVLDVADHFKIKSLVTVNKYDLNREMADRIEEHCESRGVEVVGRIPYDRTVTDAMIREKAVVEMENSAAADEIKKVWERVYAVLFY